MVWREQLHQAPIPKPPQDLTGANGAEAHQAVVEAITALGPGRPGVDYPRQYMDNS